MHLCSAIIPVNETKLEKYVHWFTKYYRAFHIT